VEQGEGLLHDVARVTHAMDVGCASSGDARQDPRRRSSRRLEEALSYRTVVRRLDRGEGLTWPALDGREDGVLHRYRRRVGHLPYRRVPVPAWAPVAEVSRPPCTPGPASRRAGAHRGVGRDGDRRVGFLSQTAVASSGVDGDQVVEDVPGDGTNRPSGGTPHLDRSGVGSRGDVHEVVTVRLALAGAVSPHRFGGLLLTY
jgi:hypothetical protein